jgi:hypothetical protein
VLLLMLLRLLLLLLTVRLGAWLQVVPLLLLHLVLLLLMCCQEQLLLCMLELCDFRLRAALFNRSSLAAWQHGMAVAAAVTCSHVAGCTTLTRNPLLKNVARNLRHAC